MYIFQLMDYYSASGMSLLWVCFFQTVALSWIFGVDKISDCIEQMMGMRPNRYWTICWKYCGPLIMIVRTKSITKFPISSYIPIQAIFVSHCVQYVNLTYGSYKYPDWAEIIGFGLSISSMIWVPLYAFYFAVSGPGTFVEVSSRLLQYPGYNLVL